MVIAEPAWLHTLGQIAGTLLLIELVLVLLVVCALMIALAIAAWWLRSHVVPVVDQYGGEAQRLLVVAQRGTDRVAQGVAEFHGRWEGIQTGIRTFFLGRRATRRGPPAVTGGEARPLAALPSPDQAAIDEPVAGIEADGHNPPVPRHAG